MGKMPTPAALAVGAAVVAVALVAAACTSSSGAPSTSVPSRRSTTAPALSVAATPPGPVPAQYAALYVQLSAGLDSYQAAVAAMPDYRATGPSAPSFHPAAELLDANGNQQAKLLAPGALTRVEGELDSFQRLGVTGVTIGIKLPLLLSQYTPRAANYADFYAAVARQARERGFTIDVELGGLFCGTAFSTCSYNYPSTVAGWAQLSAEQAKIVIARVHPDFLDILSEPNTEANLTKIPALETQAGVVEFINDTLAGIGAHRSTEIGAGAASWFPISYDEAIARTGVNVLVEHIYPLSPQISATIVATAELANQVHKPIVADEVWLYKGTTTLGANVTQSSTESKLDAYSFFEPLDQRFLTITRQWSMKADVSFTSAFWSWQLFNYVAWTPALDAGSVDQTLGLLYQGAQQAIGHGEASTSGRVWVPAG